jgi:hypothetical protein
MGHRARGIKALELVAAQREKGIQSVLNSGQSPAFLKGMGAHMKDVHTLFGAPHIKFLFGQGIESTDGRDSESYVPAVNFGDKKQFRHIDEDFLEACLQLKKDFHASLLQAYLISQKTGMPIAFDQTPYFKRNLEAKLKAFNITDFSSWIPTLNTRFFFEELDLTPELESFFPQENMSSATVRVPGVNGRLIAQLEGDTSTFSEQSQTQGSYLLEAQDFVTHTAITEDLIQDAQPSRFDKMRLELGKSQLRAYVRGIVDGDNTIATSVQGDGHMDSDVAAIAKDARKGFKGLRKKALDNAANGVVINNQGDTVNKDVFDNLLACMGKFAKEKKDLLFIVSSTIGTRIVTGKIPELLTIQNFGVNATLVTGQLPKIYGVETVENEWQREDLAPTGVYASSQNKTTINLVKKSRFTWGVRSAMRMWAAPSLPSSDRMLMTAKSRVAFNGVPQSASEKSVAIAINISQS